MHNNPKIHIATIGAMDEEIHAITSLLSHCKKYQHPFFTYYQGQLHHKNILVFQSGLGKVNAALATAYIIEQYSPQYIINIGSAGGISAKLKIGDIVISSQTFYHDVDVSLLKCAYGQIPGMPETFSSDPQLIALAQKAVSQSIHLQAIEGHIGSGDTFVSEPRHIQLLRQRFPEMIAVDMEAAAIAHTCHLYQTPFVIIRAISDVVINQNNHVDFFTFLKQASINSAKTVEHMISML